MQATLLYSFKKLITGKVGDQSVLKVALFFLLNIEFWKRVEEDQFSWIFFFLFFNKNYFCYIFISIFSMKKFKPKILFKNNERII